MISKIHLICKRDDGLPRGLRLIDKAAFIYESETWKLTRPEIEALKGGEALFHETKAQPSYFGGAILEIRHASDDPGEGNRLDCILVIQSMRECRGIEWDPRGKTYGMAWASGVIEKVLD